VAFDFDGTLTWKDSFRDFLAWRTGSRDYALGLARMGGPALAYLRNRDRGAFKAAMVMHFLGGAPKSDLEAQAQAYAAERAPLLLRPDAVRAWRRWQGEGARLVIVTATPGLIVAPFGRGLGAELVLGTRLALDADSRLTGALDGANCRGAEKVRRLRETFGQDVRLEAAYGDSDGDAEMLTLADEPGLRVFSGRPGRGPA
jgi:phosphatidylglycerophosphatase C